MEATFTAYNRRMNTMFKTRDVVLSVSLLMAACVYVLFHGYFDHGLFEIKQLEWSPSAPRRVAVVAERFDHQAMNSDTYFVLIADHVFSAAELRRAYHSDGVVFAAASDCLTVSWTDPHESGPTPSAQSPT